MYKVTNSQITLIQMQSLLPDIECMTKDTILRFSMLRSIAECIYIIYIIYIYYIYYRYYIYNIDIIYILRTTHMFKHAAMDLSENGLVKTSDSRWDPPWQNGLVEWEMEKPSSWIITVIANINYLMCLHDVHDGLCDIWHMLTIYIQICRMHNNSNNNIK